MKWTLVDLERFAALFCGRSDAFGVLQAGRICAVRRPLSLIQYRLHLEGKLRLGIYPLLPDGHTHFLALDFDGPQAEYAADRASVVAAQHGLTLCREISKSRGVHLWLFFNEPVLARDTRLIALMLLREAGVKAEIFPKQDALPADGVGNFIWLPLSGESVPLGKTVFVDPISHQAYADQWDFLHGIPQVHPREIVILASQARAGQDRPIPARPDGPARIHHGELLPCARIMLQGVTRGCRDVVAFRLAIHLKARGLSQQRAEHILRQWDAKSNQPPLGLSTIREKVISVYQRNYTSYGCEDPLIAPFCREGCPIRRYRADVGGKRSGDEPGKDR
ncbi:MAG: TOTE conflict system archaeo-eukaryotic primase domain-containing protein [Nitrospirota bacterium]